MSVTETCVYYSGQAATNPWENYHPLTLFHSLYVWWMHWVYTSNIAANAPRTLLKDPWRSLELWQSCRSPVLARNDTQIRNTHPRLLGNGSRLVHQSVSLYPPLCYCCCVWMRSGALKLPGRRQWKLHRERFKHMIAIVPRFPSAVFVVSARILNYFGG